MSDEFVEPVDGIKAGHPVELGRGPQVDPIAHHATLRGHVVAVRKQSGHHEEGHILDTSIGAEEHTEIVIRVDAGEFSDLVGKQVVVNFKP